MSGGAKLLRELAVFSSLIVPHRFLYEIHNVSHSTPLFFPFIKEKSNDNDDDEYTDAE